MNSIANLSDQEYQKHISRVVEALRKLPCFRTGERPYDVSGPSIDFATFMARYERKGGKR